MILSELDKNHQPADRFGMEKGDVEMYRQTKNL